MGLLSSMHSPKTEHNYTEEKTLQTEIKKKKITNGHIHEFEEVRNRLDAIKSCLISFGEDRKK